MASNIDSDVEGYQFLLKSELLDPAGQMNMV